MRSDESPVSKSCASSPDGRGVTPQSANLSQSTHKQVQVPTLVNHWRCRSVSGQTTITQQHSVQLAFFRNAALPAELCRIGNCVATIVVAKWEGAFDEGRAKQVL